LQKAIWRDAHITDRNLTMAEAIAAVLGAILGAIGAIYVSARTAKRTEQASATANAIAEFFSDGFLRHRVSVHRTRQKYLRGEVQISEIAAGFWYPGPGSDYFEGENDDQFNEHQHLESYLGYISRIDFLLRRGWAAANDLERALSSKLVWTDEFLCELAVETARQAEAANAPRPQWVDGVHNVSQRVIRLHRHPGSI
jgi:hypothetical protein